MEPIGSSFGDRLALARHEWVRALAGRLAERGYDDYRRSDAYVMRRLLDGPAPLGRLASPLGVSRQAGRKVVDGLVERALVTLTLDSSDRRSTLVRLTGRGRAYARALVAAIDDLEGFAAATVGGARISRAAATLAEVAAALASA